MIKLTKLTLSICFSLVTLLAIAQKPMVQVQNDKKRINVHELGLSENTPLIDVLYILPELLSRPGDMYLDNYALEINDVPVGDARDAVLSQLRVADMKFIEVSENPITSYQNNGQGGTISVELIPLEEKKICGNVSLNGEYPLDIVPSLNIGYQKDKFSVRGLVMAEFYYPKGIKQTIKDEAFDEIQSKSTDEQFLTEMARVYIGYNPSKNDELKFCLSENWRKNNTKSDINTLYYDNTNKTTSSQIENTLTDVLARVEYNHYFIRRSRFKFETVYNYNPSKLFEEQENHKIGDTIARNSLAGKVEYLHALVEANESQRADLKLGVNYNLNFSDENNKYSTSVFSSPTEHYTPLNTKCNTTYISPYFQAEYIKNSLSFKLILDYQYYKYKIKSDDNEMYENPQNNLTGKLMAGWKFAENQTIRLILDRKLKRPASTQIYPYVVYNPSYSGFVKGNPELKPILSHEVTIDYITEVKNDKRSVVLNMGMSYIYVKDVIRQEVKSFMPNYFRSTNEYITFLNEGDNNIMKTNFMMFYKRKIFALLFTANVFNNIGSKDYTTSDHYTYYNLLLDPTFNFNKGWSFDISLCYNSEVRKTDEKYGDILVSSLGVSKTFGKLSIHAYGQFLLNGETVDVKYSGKGDVTRTYNAIKNMVGLGVRYQF